MRRLLFVVTLLCAFSGCDAPSGKQATPTPTPTPASGLTKAEEVALDETIDQGTDDDYSDRAAARDAAKEFAQKALPTWTVIGVHARFISKFEYLVMVDARKGKLRETLDLMAVRFVSEDVEPYWKVRPMTINLDRTLKETEETERIKDLNKLKSERDEAEESQ